MSQSRPSTYHSARSKVLGTLAKKERMHIPANDTHPSTQTTVWRLFGRRSVRIKTMYRHLECFSVRVAMADSRTA